MAEHSHWERSEPGQGGIVIPVYDTRVDKAIAGGWRRDSPQAAFPEYEDPFLTPTFITLAEIPYESEEGGP
jgi:hypothetical protein